MEDLKGLRDITKPSCASCVTMILQIKLCEIILTLLTLKPLSVLYPFEYFHNL